MADKLELLTGKRTPVWINLSEVVTGETKGRAWVKIPVIHEEKHKIIFMNPDNYNAVKETVEKEGGHVELEKVIREKDYTIEAHPLSSQQKVEQVKSIKKAADPERGLREGNAKNVAAILYAQVLAKQENPKISIKDFKKLVQDIYDIDTQ